MSQIHSAPSAVKTTVSASWYPRMTASVKSRRENDVTSSKETTRVVDQGTRCTSPCPLASCRKTMPPLTCRFLGSPFFPVDADQVLLAHGDASHVRLNIEGATGMVLPLAFRAQADASSAQRLTSLWTRRPGTANPASLVRAAPARS